MARKKDNNLVKLTVGSEEFYYTSKNKAGMMVGLTAPSVDWALKHNNELKTLDGRNITFEIVDGSEIPYKLINNER